MVMQPIISSLQRYIGTGHPWAKDLTVVVVAVHRDDQILESDVNIGSLQPGDMIEFAPFIREGKGKQRLSFATSDARPGELVPVGGCWHGPLRYDLVSSGTPSGAGRG
jgi:hypothetical protein